MFSRNQGSIREKTPLLEEKDHDHTSYKELGEPMTPVEIAELYFDLEDRLFGNTIYDFYSAKVKNADNKMVSLKIFKDENEKVEFEKNLLTTLTGGNQFPELLPEFDNDALKAHLVMKHFGKTSLHDYHNENKLCKAEVIFFLANIVLAIEKIHDKGYVHAGLVIAEMFLVEHKYLKIVNFCPSAKVIPGKLTKNWRLNNFGIYFAPEMLVGYYYEKPVDIWMLGFIAYALLVHSFPFNRDPGLCNESKEEFAAKLKPEELDTSALLPVEATFIKALLKMEPSERLTIQQVKEHPFFKSTDFDSIDNQTYRVEDDCTC